MKNFRTISAAVLMLCCTLTVSAQKSPDIKMVAGSWMGKINAGSVPLRIIFNLSIIGKDSLAATLDSPDQGAKNIKIGPVTWSGETIRIMAPLLLGEYNGTIKNDTLIDGTWKQAGQSIALSLTKLKAAFIVNRPQEPKAPYPYSSQEVTFLNESSGNNLAGTLTIPSGKGPFPAVVLISGSGAQNRDEELMGHKPFLVLADWLTRNGIAILRYDDRGVGKSQGNYSAATTADLATDAMAAFNFLKMNSDVNPKAIGLMGHSEGGLIAPMVASKNNEIAFIVSLAGTGVPGDQIIYRQTADISRASGLSEKQISEASAANRKLFPILKKEKDNKTASEKMTAEYKKILVKKKASASETEESLKQIQSSLNPVTFTWLRYFIMTNPADYWNKVKCPVLALNGDKDLQVAAEVNLPAIEKAIKSTGNKSVTTVSLPGLNHLFQQSKTGLPSEYSTNEETFSPEALKLITEWISGLQVK